VNFKLKPLDRRYLEKVIYCRVLFQLQEGFRTRQLELQAGERAEPCCSAAEENQRIAGENINKIF